MKQSFIFVLFALIVCVPAFAEDTNIYSWERCVQTAMEFNPQLLSSKETVEASKASKGSSRAGMLPNVSASASAGRSGGSGSANNNFSYGLNANQLIFDGLKSYYNLKSADANIENSMYNYRITSANIRLELKTAFINLLKAQSLVGINEDIVKRRKHVMDLVRMRYNAGSEHRGSWYSARADYLAASASLASAKRDIDLARRSLCFIMGIDGASNISVRGDIHAAVAYSGQPDFSSLAEGSPTYLRSAAQLKSSELSLSASKAAFSPTVRGSGSIARSGEELRDMRTNWSLGLNVNAPLFSGGETWYGYKRAQAEYHQAVLNQKQTKNDVMQTMEKNWNNLLTSIENVTVQKANLEAYTERSKIGEAQYSIGTLSFDNWTIIENNLSNAQKSYLEACASALTSEAQWINSHGGTLENEAQ